MIADSDGTPLRAVGELSTLPVHQRIGNFVFAPDRTLWMATSGGLEQLDWTPSARPDRVIRAGEGLAFTPSRG
jgi:hypothetical protein